MATHPHLDREQVLRVRRRRQFKAHLSAYLLINLVIWASWLANSFNSGHWRPWPLFVTLGWGIAVLFNAWAVYLGPGARAKAERGRRRPGHRAA